MTSIKRSSPGAIAEPQTPTSSLLPRRVATLVSGSGIELREVEEAIRELEERLGGANTAKDRGSRRRRRAPSYKAQRYAKRGPPGDQTEPARFGLHARNG
ncbi:hypothetical protein AAFF_G00026590 [Aldrovandia affinis]|uniref:Uncharacterized protein n=1 Tax=Aldrovandia affinis TaxID=143900 RepID=A0AAD7WG79_9TELE|nr:hypothetical protein AAFF_G00026590 [Aldrovandia affinis]